MASGVRAQPVEEIAFGLGEDIVLGPDRQGRANSQRRRLARRIRLLNKTGGVQRTPRVAGEFPMPLREHDQQTFILLHSLNKTAEVTISEEYGKKNTRYLQDLRQCSRDRPQLSDFERFLAHDFLPMKGFHWKRKRGRGNDQHFIAAQTVNPELAGAKSRLTTSMTLRALVIGALET